MFPTCKPTLPLSPSSSSLQNPAPFAISNVLCSFPPLPSPDSEREKVRSEMRLPQTPIPPWGSKSRWYMTPTALSPSFSRHPFQGTAAAASEQPCVRTPFARSSTRVACYPPSFFNPVPPFLLRFWDARVLSPRRPAFLLCRSRCSSGGWREWKGMTRRSPSQGNLKGEQFLQKEKRGGAPLRLDRVRIGAK